MGALTLANLIAIAVGRRCSAASFGATVFLPIFQLALNEGENRVLRQDLVDRC